MPSRGAGCSVRFGRRTGRGFVALHRWSSSAAICRIGLTTASAMRFISWPEIRRRETLLELLLLVWITSWS